MSRIKLVEQTDRRIVFAHRPLGGLFLAVFGSVFVWLGLTRVGGGGGLVFAAVGGLFALAGLAVVLWRQELVLDLAGGRWRRTRGFWPSPKAEEGSLDRLRGVVLTRRWVRSSSKKSSSEHVVWTVSLEMEGWDRPQAIHGTRDEDAAYRELERWARLLERDAVDRSGEEEERTPWSELDVSLSERLAAEGVVIPSNARLPAPPAGSGIVLEDGGRTIVLPAPGMSAGVGCLVLFGLLFGGFGAVPMLVALGIGIEGEVSGPVFLIGPLFLLIGLGMAAVPLAAIRAREVVRDEGDALVVAVRVFGGERFAKRLPKSGIEDVTLRASARRRRGTKESEPPEIVVRTDEQVARLGGWIEDAEARDWVVAALRAMSARSLT